MIYEQEVQDALEALLSTLHVETRAAIEPEIQRLKLLIDLRTQLLHNLTDALQASQVQMAAIIEGIDDEGF